MTVDILCFVLGVNNCLILVETIISGDGITDGNRDQVIRNSAETKQLKGNQDRCDRTVGDAAEKCRHARSRTQRS